jgi:hypothetical protein
MKQITFTSILLLLATTIFSQSVELFTNLNISNEKRLDKAPGIGLMYFQSLGHKSGLGLSVYYKQKHAEYDRITYVNFNPSDILSAKMNSESKQVSFRLNYRYALFINEHASLSVGPEVSYNLLWGSDKNRYLTSNDSTLSSPVLRVNDKIDKIGLTFLFNFEIKNILMDNLSLNIHFRPEMLFSGSYEGGEKPYSGEIKNFEYGIGLKYYFR